MTLELELFFKFSPLLWFEFDTTALGHQYCTQANLTYHVQFV